MVFAGQFRTVYEVRICNAVLDKQCREARLLLRPPYRPMQINREATECLVTVMSGIEPLSVRGCPGCEGKSSP